jgi:hypothetical protein
VNEAKQKAMQGVADAAADVLLSARLTDRTLDEWFINGPEGRKLWDALRNIGMSPDCYLSTPARKPFADEQAKVGDVVRPIFAEDFVVTVSDDFGVGGQSGFPVRSRLPHDAYTIVRRAEEKRIPQVGEFWKSDAGMVWILESDPVPREWFDGAKVQTVAGRIVEFPASEMEFAFSARADGEFKAGDRVLFCDREWIATPDPIQKVNGVGMYLRIHLPPDAKESKPGQWCPQAYAPIDMVTLKVPVEMRG